MKTYLKKSVLLLSFIFLAGIAFSQASWNITVNDDTEPFFGKFNKDDGIIFKFKKRSDYLHFQETKKPARAQEERVIIVRPKGIDDILFEIPLKNGELNLVHFHVNRVYHLLEEQYKAVDQQFEIVETWDGGESLILRYVYI
ncbi:MAG: hypothetical protein U5Q03_04085 [Bacteroidota bacterium]|nr:hypothetical protein [Bacteroidota bacterium]